MSGKRTLSLSAYKKSKEALAAAPSAKERRLGFGESVSTREARAQQLQVETQVIGRLDELLKQCGKEPSSSQAISNWLCAEGVEGHAKKGLSRILCYVKVWSRVLRSEGVAPKTKAEIDVAEVRARAAFGACVSAINAVDSLSYRLSEKNNARNGEMELVKVAGQVLAGMVEAMLGPGAKPRARGLHPTELAQLSRMADSWKERGALPPPSFESVEERLSALRSSDAAENGSGTARSSKVWTKNQTKRAAWVQMPTAPAAAVWSADGAPGGLSPPRPRSSGADAVTGSRLPAAAPRTDEEYAASVEAALKELLAPDIVMVGGWWAQAFQGSGPFPQGPEGCWSLQFQRANEDPGVRQLQAMGSLDVNGDHRGDFAGGGLDRRGVKTEGVDGKDSDGTPSTPSTVPSEASPSPERASPPQEVKLEAGKDLDAKPLAAGGDSNGTAAVAAVSTPEAGVAQASNKEKASASKDEGEGEKGSSSPIEPVLSKREREEQERRRRKEEARRAGKEMGKAKALERERQKKERELQRQEMIAEARKKKAEYEAAKREKEAKEQTDELARRSKAAEHEHEHEHQEPSTTREREKYRRRDKPAGKSTDEPKRDAGAEHSRHDHRDGGNKASEGQHRMRDRERRNRAAGGGNWEASAADAERAFGGQERDDSRRRGASADNRGRLAKEDRERGKGTDHAAVSRRDRDEGRPHHDLGDSRDTGWEIRGRGHQDSHEQPPRGDDRGTGDDARRRGSSSQPTREARLSVDGGRPGLDSREREVAGDKGERKRRRGDLSESEGVGASIRRGGDSRHHDERGGEDERSSSHRPSKKKSKKDKRDRKDKRGNRHLDVASARPSRTGSEESSSRAGSRKRSRDFDRAQPPVGYAAAALHSSSDLIRRSQEPHRQRSEARFGGSGGGEVRDGPRHAMGRSRIDSDSSPRRGDRRDGSEKRARRSGSAGESAHGRTGASSRERHARGGGAGRESAAAGASLSSDSSAGGVALGAGGPSGGLPGMEEYSSAASPPTGLELGGFGKAAGGHGLGSLKMVDVYGPTTTTGSGDSPDGGGSSRRRRGDGGKDGGGGSGGRSRSATADAYRQGVDDSSQAGGRSDRERSERDRAERDRSERDYARAADKSARESSGRRRDVGSRPSSSSHVHGSRRSPERGMQSSSARDGSFRRRPGSPPRDDSRGRPSDSRDRRHSKSGVGAGTGGRLTSAAHSGMGMGNLGVSMSMGMGVSMIGGTSVLMPVAKMMEVAAAAAANSRGSDRRSGGGGGRWGGGGGEDDDRWGGGDSHSEGDDLDRSLGRSDARSGRRRDRDSGGSGGSRRDRADSRDDAAQALLDASPQEEEPEEGELVIESSMTAVRPSSPASTSRKKSRWGNVRRGSSPSGEARGEGMFGHAVSRRDYPQSRERGEASGGGGRSGGGDGEPALAQDPDNGWNAMSPGGSSMRKASNSRNGPGTAIAQEGRRTDVDAGDNSSSPSKDPKDHKEEHKPTSEVADSEPRPGQAEDRAGSAAAASAAEKLEPSSPQLSPTAKSEDGVDAGTMGDGNDDTAASRNDAPLAAGSAAGSEQDRAPAPVAAEAATDRESTAVEAAGGGTSPTSGVAPTSASAERIGSDKDKEAVVISASQSPAFKKSDSEQSAAAGGGGGGGGGATDARGRVRRHSPEDLTSFLRKCGSSRKSEEPVSTATTPAADVEKPRSPAGSAASEEGSVREFAASATNADAGVASADASVAPAAAAKPQRASVFTRLGAPPGETKDKDPSKTAAATPPDRSSGTPESAPPRGIAASWGSDSSADWTSSRERSGSGGGGGGSSCGGGNGNGNGNGDSGTASAGAKEVTPVRRVRSAAKDESRPVGGGGAGRLMNAALSSSRESGRSSGKKVGASGRGRGGGRRQRE